MTKPILVGAVAYDPKVVPIWDIITEFFVQNGVPMDYVFYSNYEMLVDALLAGHVHIAWNSPLAWVDAQRRSGGTCRAIAMRDTDRNRVTHIITRKGSGVDNLAQLRGKTIATGAKDSPQATLLPLHLLQRNGVTPYRDITVRRFDLMVGKHGDHIGGELEALRCLERGEAHAACVLDLNWQAWQADGTANPAKLQSIGTTEPFDHCNFTVRKDFPKSEEDRWLEALFAMTYSNPDHRKMMDMEGLKEWMPGRTSHYAALTAAAEEQNFFSNS
jgi:phosphonate transport system substrate-binding protein